MRPEANHFDRADILQHLIHQAVLDVDAAGTGAGEIADELLKRGWGLVGVTAEDIEQRFGFWSQAGGGEFLGVFLGLAREDQLPGYHVRRWRHRATGVCSPLRMDSRIPGMDTR